MDFNGDGIMDVLIRTQNADGGFMMAYKAGPMRSVSGTCAPTTLIPLSANGKGIPVPLARSSGGHEVWMYEGDTFSGPDGGQAAIAAGLPVTGQFNGLTEDGILAVFTNGTWQGSGLPVSFSSLFGQAGDIPVPGDYLGLGYDQRAVVRNEAGQLYWYWEHPDGGLGGGPFGVAGDVPIPADYNRDGVLDVAVYRYDGRVVFIALPDASTLELPQGASGAPSNVFPCALTASEMGYCTWRFDDISTVSFDLHTVAAGFAETCSATMPGFVAVIGSHQWAIP